MKLFKTLLLATTFAITGLLNNTTSLAAPPAGTVLAKDQVLNLNFSSALTTLDPTLITYDNEFLVQRLLNDTLFRTNNTGKFIPSLAESYTVSPDGLTWTFKLRKAKWSDGEPIRAQDFAYSWRRLTNPKTASIYSYYLELANVKNAKAVADGKLPPSALGVAALDDQTFQVQLANPIPWFISMISLSILAPERQDIIEKYGDKWVQPENMVVSGPYKVASYNMNDVLKFIRNPQFWDDKNTTLTNINVDFISNPTTNYYGFIAGKYLTSDVPPQFQEAAIRDMPEAINKVKQNTLTWLLVNPKVVPDVRIREALSLLTDRKLLTQKVLRSGIATTILAPKSIQGAQDMQESAYLNNSQQANAKQAVALLQAAGYSTEQPLKLKFLSNAKDPRFFVALQSLFNKGSQGLVNLTLEKVEDKIYYDRSERMDYEIELGNWIADYPQVTTFVDLFKCGNNIGFATFCDPKFDELLMQAKYEQDADKRAMIYAQAEKIARAGYIYIPVYQTQTYTLKRPQLQGFNPNLLYRYPNDYYIVANPSATASN